GAGKIITVGSGIGHRGVPGSSAYACAKAGLWMLTRVLAQELWPSNISVNELIPGPVVTQIVGEPAAQRQAQRHSVLGQGEWGQDPAGGRPARALPAPHAARRPDGAEF